MKKKHFQRKQVLAERIIDGAFYSAKGRNLIFATSRLCPKCSSEYVFVLEEGRRQKLSCQSCGVVFREKGLAA